MSPRSPVITLLLVAAALAAGAAAPEASGGPERTTLEAILVRVNDRIVTVSDFRRKVRSELSQLASQPTGDELRSFTASLFDQTVDELVLLERASDKKISVEDENVDKAMAALREDNKLQDDADFAKALAEAGLSEDGLRQRYRESMLLQRVVQSEVRPTEITEEEIRVIYEREKEAYRVPARVAMEQLFFPSPPTAAEQRELLRRVLAMVERVRAGADLIAEATLAGVEVQDLGEIPEVDLRPELLTILAPLADGELSDPVEMTGGIQVIRLVRRIPAGYRDVADVKEEIRRRESMRSYQDQSRGLVGRLKADYLVEVHRDRLGLVFEGWADAS